jgi:hypothetical protein
MLIIVEHTLAMLARICVENAISAALPYLACVALGLRLSSERIRTKHWQFLLIEHSGSVRYGCILYECQLFVSASYRSMTTTPLTELPYRQSCHGSLRPDRPDKMQSPVCYSPLR